MWFIRRKHDGKNIYLAAKEYTVGRKACTIEIIDDATVSRKHCQFLVSKFQDNQPPSCKVMDLKSTFGVYVMQPNSTSTTRLNPNEWVEVTNNSTVVFGSQNHWVVGWQDIPVLVSGNVHPDRKKRLQALLETLGAKACHDWHPNVMCLVMDRIAFTHKVLDVLLAAKPITTIEFFERWLEQLNESPDSSSPNPSDYLPPIDASLATLFKEQDFLPNPLRKELFAGKTFIFPLPEQLNSTAATAIRNAGGQAVPGNHSSLNDDQLIIIDRGNTPEASLSECYVSQAKSALNRGERLIPEREISLAILSASCQRYCNPHYGRIETKSAKKTERQEPTASPNEEPPTKKPKYTPSEEPMDLEAPPSKKLRCTSSNEAPMTQVTLKNTQRLTPSAPVVAKQEAIIVRPSDRGAPNRTSASFLDTTRSERSVNTTRARCQDSHLERSQIVRTQSFRSTPRQPCKKTFEKNVPKRVSCMKTMAYRDGRWV